MEICLLDYRITCYFGLMVVLEESQGVIKIIRIYPLGDQENRMCKIDILCSRGANVWSTWRQELANMTYLCFLLQFSDAGRDC